MARKAPQFTDSNQGNACVYEPDGSLRRVAKGTITGAQRNKKRLDVTFSPEPGKEKSVSLSMQEIIKGGPRLAQRFQRAGMTIEDAELFGGYAQWALGGKHDG